MSITRVSTNDQEEPQEQSPSTRPGKATLIKKPRAQKSSVVKTENPLAVGKNQEGRTSPTNGDVQVRIAERAYELYHRRGGHHGQDFDDWLTAEQEIFSEDA